MVDSSKHPDDEFASDYLYMDDTPEETARWKRIAASPTADLLASPESILEVCQAWWKVKVHWLGCWPERKEAQEIFEGITKHLCVIGEWLDIECGALLELSSEMARFEELDCFRSWGDERTFSLEDRANTIFRCIEAKMKARQITSRTLDDSKTKAPAGGPVKEKKSTVRGEAQEKIIAALTKHHKYADGSCLNLEAIKVGELARLAEVGKASVNRFFDKQFGVGEPKKGGHKKYIRVCGDTKGLIPTLKLLNREFAASALYGRNPPNEGQEEENE